MAITTFLPAVTYLPTNALQPDTVWPPPGVPTWTDVRPTQSVAVELLLPANTAAGSPAYALPVPATATAVYEVQVYNADTAGYARLLIVDASNNKQSIILPPGGGHFGMSFYSASSQPQPLCTPTSAWTLQAVDLNGLPNAGTIGSPTATRVLVYIAFA